MTAASPGLRSGDGALARAARRLAAWLPAILIAYSALIDPLLNLGDVERQYFGGIEVGGETKSTVLTQIFMPAMLALAMMLATLAPPRVPARLRLVLGGLAVFLALALASTAWSLGPTHTLKLAVYQTILCSVIGLSVAVSGDPARLARRVFWVFVAVVAINLAFAVIRPPGPIGHQGIYPNKNLMGSAAGCAFIFGLFFVGRGPLLQRMAAVATVLGAVLLLAISLSKTAIGLAFAAPAGAIGLYLLSRLLGLSVVTVFLIAAALAGAGYVVFSQATGHGVSDLLLVAFGNDTFTGRTGVWQFAWSHIRDAPWLGHGHRGFWGIGEASPKLAAEIEFIRLTGSSHSGYLDTMLDLGMAGLAALAIYVVAILGLCARFGLRSPASSMLFLSVVLFVLGRNAMESVVLWSTFFDAQCFILVGFLAGYAEGGNGTDPSAAGVPARHGGHGRHAAPAFGGAV